MDLGRIIPAVLLVLAFTPVLGCRQTAACPSGSAVAEGSSACSPTQEPSENDGQENPTPESDPEPEPNTDPREPAAENFDLFHDVAYRIGSDVDGIYSSYRELLESRTPRPTEHPSDHCSSNLNNQLSFSDRIASAVSTKMTSSKPQLSYVASYFGLSSDQNSYVPTGLISHELCPVTAASLQVTYQGKNIPSATLIAKADRFSKLANEYRRQTLAGERDGLLKSNRLWSKFMMCLSYVESLTTADSTRSDQIALEHGFRRPAGVKLYMDPAQSDPASKFNIGLFQFSPGSGGNIQSCIREWNEKYPSCAISRTTGPEAMLRILGSPLQTFNSFCGVSKISGMFGVQVNTTKTKNTHPANVLSNGALKPSGGRCVSPFMNTSTSYNHFGPLQNSTGRNLDELLSCTLAGEI